MRLNDFPGNAVFTFNVSGTVQGGAILPAPVVIDNGKNVTEFIYSRDDVLHPPGYQGDMNYTRGDNTGDYAQWTFTNSALGHYRISTNWVKGTSRASNAPYTLTGVTAGRRPCRSTRRLAPTT